MISYFRRVATVYDHKIFDVTMLLKYITDPSSENMVLYDFEYAEYEYGVRIFATSNIQGLIRA